MRRETDSAGEKNGPVRRKTAENSQLRFRREKATHGKPGSGTLNAVPLIPSFSPGLNPAWLFCVVILFR